MNYINHNIAGLFILTLVLIAICFWYLFIPQTILIEYSASIMTTGSLMLLLGYLNTKKAPSKSYNITIWIIILFISYLIIRLSLKQDLFFRKLFIPINLHILFKISGSDGLAPIFITSPRYEY